MPRELVAHETGAESWGEKGFRKMKQQPLVPLGILATCIAFFGAAKTMNRKGVEKAQFNRWLRFRVIAQGATVAACVAGSYVFGKEAKRKKALEDEMNKQRDVERERARFQESLARAEELQKQEDDAVQQKPPTADALRTPPPQNPNSTWWGWWRKP
ncbi:hypothetical protein EXIGLDRAFT_734101 [Exidia glandulosa HHB12029]|uniref:HIG1 domain-containing protein n=1 Tax=Exidia glandulosa HHB12029 TaxID=1314781 RepID=A0A165K9P5_EXIGL|nr:hypothetical protein EXIGLDRAFT_734101 [Exidia glandulosa HHB12029]